ncbi:MAG: error-prone DNA polymerase [Planctomycetota bacterium]
MHEHPGQRTDRSRAPDDSEAGHDPFPAYAELHCLSNFSFLRGASHPEELVERAAELGYAALAITDRNSLAGVVRAHVAARELGLHLIIGAEITPIDAPPVVLLAPDRRAYGCLARLITRGRLRVKKGECEIRLADVAELCRGAGLLALLLPGDQEGQGTSGPGRGGRDAGTERQRVFTECYRHIFGPDLYLAAELRYGEPDDERLARLALLAEELAAPLVAANGVHYHVPERRYLQDVLTCVREKCTIAAAGARLFANAERHLRPRDELARRYAGRLELVRRSVEIARRCTFRLDELRYQYPHELVPPGRSAHDHLAELTWAGAAERYPAGVPDPVCRLVDKELALIAELHYEHYFLTVWDLVRYARSRGILCQGRGSAANSAVCYCLGVTAVDPARVALLFERFISRERNEPPDIDVDFEHERREEVFQYIYRKYGRERAAITAEVITYRPRSAVRDVGKALGLSLDRVDTLAKALDWWSAEAVPEEALRAAGFDPQERTIQMIVRLVRQLLGFPRHLSQHVGGFVITETPLCEIVPLENGALPERTFIEWDKDDIDALGILKVDCLSLGMLTAIHKGLDLVNESSGLNLQLDRIPPEDAAVYDMICSADTVGVFQVESRAQMSMLPRLRPRCYYDLVIEVAIVRPGPIQGGMIHPYLRRRNGDEAVTYPSAAMRSVLGKTLGVPLFQEQVMQIAVVAAGFTPGEADRLRRLMAAWRRAGQLERMQTRLIEGLLRNGYSPAFAEQIYQQIRGFGEYGFPESHAASFALLVYVSGWLKRYHPAAFCGAVLNSQPMGFYAPAQLVRDARRHGVPVLPVDINCSRYDCTLEDWRHSDERCDERARRQNGGRAHDALCERAMAWGRPGPALRLGMRLVRGLSAEKVKGLEDAQRQGPITSIRLLDRRPDVSRDTLLRLAAADAFRSLGLSRREALWQILALDDADQPLLAELEPTEAVAALPPMPPEEVVVQDYDALGLSLNAHPLELVRTELAGLRLPPQSRLRVSPARALAASRPRQRIAVAGLVTHRQRPATAKGLVFMTLEDETGTANLIIRPRVWAENRRVAQGKVAVIAEGTVERQGAVIHIQVSRLHDLSAIIAPIRAKSRDFH